MDEQNRILDAAEGLFKKYGIRSITMSDISATLGMSKKTLYLYIENKDDLIEKLLKRNIERDKVEILSIQQQAENALQEWVLMNIEAQKKIQEFNPALLYDMKKYHSNVWTVYEQFHNEFIYGCICHNLARGVQEGLYRQNIHPEILSKIYMGFFPIFTDYELFPMHQYPRTELLREFISYHLHGIVSDKGREMLTGIFGL